MGNNIVNNLRIGIPIIGNKGWLGGVHYIKSLVEAVNSLPKNERPRIFLVVYDQTLNWCDLHRDFFPLLDGFIFFGRNILGAKTTLPPPVIHCRTLRELNDSLDFFYPVVADILPDLCSGSWIYDFQHIYLPEFFPGDEITTRNTKFKHVAETAKLVVLSSKTAEQDFWKIFPESKAVTRVLSFHPLPSEHWLTLDPSETQQKYSLPDKFLICCNQFWIHKNHKRLFEAMADVVRAAPDVHLVCTGSTGDWRFQNYFSELLDFIKTQGLQNWISILGQIPRIDQIQLMRRSIAVIHPSLFEGWSSVVEESRMLGKTIILSDFAVHLEQAPDHAVYFDRNNAKDLAKKILDVLPELGAGPNHVREQEAKKKSIDLVESFGRNLCSIALEAQKLFKNKISDKSASQPLSNRDYKGNTSSKYPKISIVTPSFNQGRFLEECIDSILSQNYPNLEYIIMDGGSTDNSVEIIKKYEKFLTYWQSRPDGGHYTAVNEGFKKSTGEIMGWLNSDDKFHPNGLFVLGEVFSRFPNVRVLTGKRIGFDGAGNIRSFGFEQQTWNRSMLLDKNTLRRQLFIMQEATYWRRELWEKAGAALDLSYKFAADLALWLKFARFTQLHTVDALIAGFRYYGKQQRSQIFLKEYMAECERILNREKKIKSVEPHLDGVSPPLIPYPVGGNAGITVKKEKPKISIVTPSFNQGRFLEECIDSILSQNYPNLEYIIMDGGSTDNSVDIIKKYEKHLTYWQSRPDDGHYAAVNEGFNKTTGEIMTWLNSDDLLHPEALDKVSEILSRSKEIDWIMGRPNSIDDKGKQSWILDFLPLWSREKYLKGKYRNPYIQQEGTFWRRKLWEKTGGALDTNWKLAADMDLWARFFRHAQLHSVDALLGAYRTHAAQKTATLLEEYNREAERIIDREIEFYERGSDKTLLPAPPPVKTDRLSPPAARTETVVMSSTADEKSSIKVSAIVSSYNAERFIRGCLEDLVNQSLYQDGRLEIIVVDSGSRQNEKAIVEEFMQRYKNIIYIRTKEREGVYAAWNRGIKVARGEYITNANTDDRHRSDSLEVMAFMLNRTPDTGLVYADVLITDKENETYEKHTGTRSYRWEEFRREFLACHNYIGPQPMWKKSLHDKHGYFDESFVVSGDWEFWLRIARGTKFLHIPEYLGLYLASPWSIEHENLGNRAKEDSRIHKIYVPEYFPNFEEHYTSVLRNDPLNGNAVYYLGRVLTSLGKYDRAIDVYSSYLEKNPGNTNIYNLLEEVKILRTSTPALPGPETNKSIPQSEEQEKIRVSALVSTYNSERFIRGCLEDLVNQTLYQKGELEIIVVNSGSGQNEEAVVREFQTGYKNILYLRTQERETVYAAWNRGIKAASGRYITNANTDDRRRQDALELMAGVLDQNPGIGLVYADVIITEKENETFDKHTPAGYFQWPDFDRKKLSLGCFIGPQPMWKKSLHDKYGYFNETFTSSGDWEFWLRIAEGTDFLHIRDFLGLYLRSPESVEHMNTELRMEEDRAIYRTYIPKYLPAYEKAFAGFRSECSGPVDTYRDGQILAALGKYDEAIKLYEAFLRKHPENKGFSYLLQDMKTLKAVHLAPPPVTAALPAFVMDYINKADAHIAKGDLASAREAINQAINHASGHPQLCGMLSTILENLQSPESAADFLGTKEKGS